MIIKPGNLSYNVNRYVDKATELKVHEFCRLSGELVWLGSGTLPQAACVGSLLRQ